MGRREIADLEAKLFEEEKRGCLGLLVGPRKIGEIDYERHEDGGSRLKVGLRGARLPEGTRKVTVLVNDAPVTELEVTNGSGYLRLETARGDVVPEIDVKDTAAMRAGDVTVCSGTFHRD
jgi:hypothetical protein